jgi:glucose-6-phosphate-specific signal transduction histidine kinase
MRLKLVLIVSLVAAFIGSGTSIAIIFTVFSSLKPITTPGLLVLSTILLPAISVFLASTFVYRHTARRRKLQAALTAILSILLSLAGFILASIVTSRFNSIPPPRPAEQRKVI